jgi:hypothetical protein
MFGLSGGEEILLAFNAPERSQPRAVRPAAKAKASRPAVTRLLAKAK